MIRKLRFYMFFINKPFFIVQKTYNQNDNKTKKFNNIDNSRAIADSSAERLTGFAANRPEHELQMVCFSNGVLR